MRSLKWFFISLLVISMTGFVYGASIGVLPGTIELENIEPGETYEYQIFVTTNFDSNFTVNPSANSGTSGRIIESSSDPERVSEQGSSGWFVMEQTAVDPNNSDTFELEGSVISAEESIIVGIEVPEDAEPGIHQGRIFLNANIDTGDTPGATTFGETNVKYTIDIEGDAYRDVNVQDVRGFRTDEDRASIEVLLTNSGTVTASTDRFEVDILDSQGSVVDSLRVSGVELGPGESEWTNARWSGDIEEGTYQVDGEVDYITGSAYASGSFSLSDVVEVVPDDSPTTEGGEGDGLPLWLVLMVLTVLGVLMWSFEIDPVWIFGIVGVLAISSFILFTGISNLLIVGVLIPALLIVYLGM